MAGGQVKGQSMGIHNHNSMGRKNVANSGKASAFIQCSLICYSPVCMLNGWHHTQWWNLCLVF